MNVMVKRSNPLHVVFVDWDWAGKNGEVEYPVSINPDIPRHSTAVGLAPIEKIHDIFMFERLFPSLASSTRLSLFKPEKKLTVSKYLENFNCIAYYKQHFRYDIIGVFKAQNPRKYHLTGFWTKYV